jgi:Protein of unknown function (DUF3631)/CHC2 zinc finger
MTAHFDSWTARARAVPIEHEIDRRGIKLRGAVERVGPCPKCGGEDRFAINTKKGVWNCRGCGVGGDVIELVQHLDGVDFKTACATLTGEPQPKANGRDHAGEPRKVVAAEFPYEDENGAVLFAVERIEFQNADGSYVLTKEGKRKKAFRHKRPDPSKPGRCLWNVNGVPALPYRLPGIIEAIAVGCFILIPEGEGKVELLGSWNIPATCCAGGAKKWRAEHSAFLRGGNVVILPDNDDAGRAHMNVVAASLQGIAASIRVLKLPGLPPKGDVIDWAASGGTAERLHDLIEKAPDWLPPMDQAESADSSDVHHDEAQRKEDSLLEALSQLPPGIEFARQRRRAAKELGVSTADIDAELKARRNEEDAAPLYGHWNVDPWPEAVDGDALLRDIIRRLQRHVVCSGDDAVAIALWIMLSWVHEKLATFSPILLVTSAQPESGKSTTLGLIKFLALRCLASVEISEAALYRSIALWRPSFAIDEFDSVLASDDKTALRSVINSGHTRGQGVVRCGEPDFSPQLFDTFCPKALGMVGRKLPDTTLGRCITVALRRRKTSERVEKFTHRDDSELTELRSRLLRWAADSEDTLREANPSMPPGFDNRRADNWCVMFAIADLADDDWGDKAREAAGRLERASDTTSIGVQLLADIKRIFDEEGRDCILSAVLVDKLKEDDELPWAAWGKGNKGLTQNSLASLLSGGGGRGRGGFGIRSETVHPSRDVHGRGYKRSAFEDTWARYLSPESSEEASSPSVPPE